MRVRSRRFDGGITVIEYALIMLFVLALLVWLAWRAMRDLWAVLPEDEDEHAEPFTKAPGLPHNRRKN